MYYSDAIDGTPIVSLDIPVTLESGQKASSPLIPRRMPVQLKQNGHGNDNSYTSDITVKRPHSPLSSEPFGKRLKFGPISTTGNTIEIDEDIDGSIIID